MKNVILVGMIIAGIAVIATANKKPQEEIKLSVGDLKKPVAGKSTVVFEDDYEGEFKSAKKVKDKVIISESEDDGEIVEDDGDDNWNDKEAEEDSDGSVEEVEDFSDDESVKISVTKKGKGKASK